MKGSLHLETPFSSKLVSFRVQLTWRTSQPSNGIEPEISDTYNVSKIRSRTVQRVGHVFAEFRSGPPWSPDRQAPWLNGGTAGTGCARPYTLRVRLISDPRRLQGPILHAAWKPPYVSLMNLLCYRFLGERSRSTITKTTAGRILSASEYDTGGSAVGFSFVLAVRRVTVCVIRKKALSVDPRARVCTRISLGLLSSLFVRVYRRGNGEYRMRRLCAPDAFHRRGSRRVEGSSAIL